MRVGAAWMALALVPQMALAQQSDPELDPFPPAGVYIPIPRPTTPIPPSPIIFAPGGPPVPIFVNGGGGTYYAGSNNSATNRTTILNSGSATVPAFNGSQATWDAMMNCVRNQFARFNVEVTDVQPTRAHVEAVVGGTPDLLGLPNGVGGVAPIDPYGCNVVENAVTFIFSDVLGSNAQVMCEVVAQEVAHSFSLDHELLCQDPMTYLRGCGAKSFQDVDAQCGENQARACICNRSRQNSVQIMLEKLGPVDTGGTTSSSSGGGTVDTVAPTVNVTAPTDGAMLPANSVITVSANAADETQLQSVELLWAYNGSTFACPFQSQSVNCTASNGTFTWTLRVGTGSRSFRVRARDGAGHETVTPNMTVTLTDGTTGADTVAPTVTLVRPGANAQANTQLAVEARATDNVQVQSVELVWQYTGDTFSCPSNRSDVVCNPSGNSYTWYLNVGSGSRSFLVRARDAAGNIGETPLTTVNLSDAPPVDTTPPTVMLLRPSNGATFADGATVEVAASATDNTAVTTAELLWGDGMDTYPCPYAAPGMTCSVMGNTFVWRITAHTGSIPIQVRVYDGEGNEATTSPVIISVGGGGSTSSGGGTSGGVSSSGGGGTSSGGGASSGALPNDDNSEPNNDVAHATRMFCSQSAAYVAQDADHYVVEARAGDYVVAEVNTLDVDVTWLSPDGNALGDVAETGAGVVARASNVPGGDVYVRVTPRGGRVDYTLSIRCSAGDAQGGAFGLGSCSHSGISAGFPWALLLLGAALARALGRRRA